MSVLKGRRILLAMTGGIAAYKGAAIVRHLTALGAEVRVVMTAGACEFITPLTMEVLSGHPVVTELFRPGSESDIGHIELARWPELILVAPATANVIAKMRHGFADDLLTTILLATTATVLVCPAMNTQMLLHPATRENIEALRGRRSTYILEPDAGDLACGEVGSGRLPDPDVIEDEITYLLEPKPLAGVSMMVSAGPTREHFDPVRFLTNPSTGKMGYALAIKARHLGADVTLVSGPTALPAPRGMRMIYIQSAADLRDAVFAHAGDVVVMTAAVADYTPAETMEHKRKKGDSDWQPLMARTTDILATLSTSSQRPRTLIGFAAETQEVERYARLKLEKKGLDGIVANNVAGPNGAFGNEQNEVTLIDQQNSRVIPTANKITVAREICMWIASIDGAKH